MTIADVEDVLARCRRLRDGVRSQRGSGATWTVDFPDGITEQYTIRGQQPVDDLEDDVKSLFVWLWATKDHLKAWARARGQDPQRYEYLVNRTPALCLLGEVANVLKHAQLDRPPRSGIVPRLGRPRYSLDQAHLKSLTVSTGSVDLEPTRPDAVELSYPVLDSASGRVVADAIGLLAAGVSYWERAMGGGI